MKRFNAFFLWIEFVWLTAAIPSAIEAQNTIGTLLNEAGSIGGYTLLVPTASTNTYLIDNCGQIIQEWSSDYRPGLAAYLLPNGDLIRSVRLDSDAFDGGGIGGGFERWDWEGNLMGFWDAASDSLHAHHDFTVLPNGNLLFIAWERHSGDEAIAKGRNPELTSPEVWVTRVEERNANDEVVWHWSVWDHLVQEFDSSAPHYGASADFPGKIDLNFEATALGGGAGPGGGALAAADWLHVNAIDYHPGLDQIALSSRKFNEIWIINHGLSAEEAAGPAGDVLYRWGNPRAYGRGTEADQALFGQHDVHWSDWTASHALMVFNNGFQRPEGAYSTVEEWTPAMSSDGSYEILEGEAFGPTSPANIYPETGTLDFYSGNLSGAQRLPNGNTLMCEGATGRLTEVQPDETLVWEYVNPVSGFGPLAQGNQPLQNAVFLARRYPPDFPGFEGRTMTPGLPIEVNPDLSECELHAHVDQIAARGQLQLAPNPGQDRVSWSAPQGTNARFEIFSFSGQVMASGSWSNRMAIDTESWPPGHYLVHTFGSNPQDCNRLKWLKI